jgi:hypothetical protein
MVSIGADCVIRWSVSSINDYVYISFGQYDENNHTDTYGIPDDSIFFYVSAETELRDYLKGYHDGWQLVSYNLAMRSE